MFFTNARYRSMHVEWTAVAPSVVAAFRAAAANAPGDPEFDRLVRDLSTVSPEFGELWARHDVGTPTPAVKAVHHPDVGDLVFDMTPMILPDSPDWHVELYNSRPGTGTAERIEQLQHPLATPA